MLKAAILASGNGTNAQRFFDMAADGTLDIDIRLVLCNRPGAGVLERAKKAGVPSLCLDHKTFPSREAFDQAMIRAIREAGADTIVLAGYMRLLTNAFLQAFPGRIINIHPAYGVKITGCTVHFVDEIMDHGEVIIQAAMPHAAGEPVEDLRMRIHAAEHRIYPQALQWLSEGRISRKGREVFLAPGNKPLAPQPEGMLIWPPLEEGF